MRVLLVNFEMDLDSPVLAWQAKVAQLLADRVEHLTVFTERLGRFEAHPTMVVEAMPHRPGGIPRRLGSAWFMTPRIRHLLRRDRIDVCFVHMASDWVYRLAPVVRPAGVPVLLWYAHGTVSARLRLAHALTSAVVTSTPEGFRVPSDKTTVIGQGIDTRLFRLVARRSADELLFVGRLSRRKRVHLLVEALPLVRKRRPEMTLRLVGPLLTMDDQRYAAEVRALVRALDLEHAVHIDGARSQAETVKLYERAALHLNVSATGSMDKTVLEALACGCPVVTSNQAFRDLLAPLPGLFLEDDSPKGIAEAVVDVLDRLDVYDPHAMRALIVGRHDLDHYMDEVESQLRELVQPRRSL